MRLSGMSIPTMDKTNQIELSFYLKRVGGYDGRKYQESG